MGNSLNRKFAIIAVRYNRKFTRVLQCQIYFQDCHLHRNFNHVIEKAMIYCYTCTYNRNLTIPLYFFSQNFDSHDSMLSSSSTHHSSSSMSRPSVKHLFGNWGPKFRKSMTNNERRRVGSTASQQDNHDVTGPPPQATNNKHLHHLKTRDKSPSPPVKRNRTPSVLSEGSNSEKRKSAFY